MRVTPTQMVIASFFAVAGLSITLGQYWEKDLSFQPVFEGEAHKGESISVVMAGRQSDGRYVFNGGFTKVNGVDMSAYRGGIRLNPDGSLDPSLRLSSPFIARVVEADGHLIAEAAYSGSSSLVRLTVDGRIVATYAGSGYPLGDVAGEIYVRPENLRTFVRYRSDGSLDSAYAPSLPGSLLDVSPLPDGRVYATVGGESWIAGEPARVIRLLASGARDSTFAVLDAVPYPVLYYALPDAGLLMIRGGVLRPSEDFLQFARYNAEGEKVYGYDGPADTFTLAGVVLDSLLATGPGGILVPAATFIGTNLPYRIDIRSSGEATINAGLPSYMPGPPERYRRTTLVSPSVPLAPSIGREPVSTATTEGDVVALDVQPFGLEPFAFQWKKDGMPIEGAMRATLPFAPVGSDAAGNYTVTVTNSIGSVTSAPATLTVNPAQPIRPKVIVPPTDAAAEDGGSVSLFSSAAGYPKPRVKWQRNGIDVAGATELDLSLANFRPVDAGLYALVASNDSGITTSAAAIVGLSTTERVVGNGDIVDSGVHHPNGNTYDQVLVTGSAEAITARPGTVTRTSFIDPSDNIVQVEFSGAGTLTLVLQDPSGPAQPVDYNQDVRYMKGLAGIVITGADETTNVSVFSVGRATAFDPTGTYNILKPPSDTNRPADNGSPLFAGHSAADYDGAAQIAFIAIAGHGDFGGVRTGNVHYRATHGITGLYAPGRSFFGPVYVGDITASGDATPVLMVGLAPLDIRVTGGNLEQDNGRAVEVSHQFQLQFTPGIDSGGNPLPAQVNLARFDQFGEDVTIWITWRS